MFKKIEVTKELGSKTEGKETIKLQVTVTGQELDANLTDLLLEQGAKVLAAKWLQTTKGGENAVNFSGELSLSDLVEWFETTGGSSSIVDQYEAKQAELVKIARHQASIMEQLFSGELDQPTAFNQAAVQMSAKTEAEAWLAENEKAYHEAIEARKARGQQAAATRKANEAKAKKK
jgi:hypothetical protein